MTDQILQQNYGGETVGSAFSQTKRIIDTLQTLLDCDSFLGDIEHQLRGEMWDHSSHSWNRRHKSLLSDTGVEVVMTQLRSRINVNFILSNFGDEDVRQMALETKSGLLDIFLTQHHKLGISTTEEATMLSDMIDHSVFAMFRRSLNQTTINLLKETVSRIENVAEEKKTPKKFFNIL